MIDNTTQIRRRDVHFVLGRSLNSIATDIYRLDLGWERVSATRWKDENDNLVVYLNNPHFLYGRPAGARVFLLPGFDQRDDWWELSEAMHVRECECEYLEA